MKTKMKTNKAAAKRIKLTGTGKMKFKRANLRHCLGHRKKKNKRQLRHGGYLPESHRDAVSVMLPYGSPR